VKRAQDAGVPPEEIKRIVNESKVPDIGPRRKKPDPIRDKLDDKNEKAIRDLDRLAGEQGGKPPRKPPTAKGAEDSFEDEPNQPPLRRIHPDSTYDSDVEARESLNYWRTRSTEEIVESLRPKWSNQKRNTF